MKLTKLLFQLLEKNQKTTLPAKYADNDIAMKMIKDEIDQMAWEIRNSQKGNRAHLNYGVDAIRIDTKSTFPKYLQQIFNNSGTTKKFVEVAKRGKGKVWDRVALVAIDRLENGYKNRHGFDTPCKDFIDIVENPVPF